MHYFRVRGRVHTSADRTTEGLAFITKVSQAPLLSCPSSHGCSANQTRGTIGVRLGSKKICDGTQNASRSEIQFFTPWSHQSTLCSRSDVRS
jgi:hypothetical protein